ncbi:small subunit processome component 20 homolog [Antedon mediterranea]|uniref:small subunit processome component 20 homolog n=1 Tax=Antedon mediterranea TaxID=105859 RepID=UPI003AF5ED17
MSKRSSKSSYHKNENRFKFETFSERLAKVNIDVIRHGSRTQQLPEDADSFFAEGLAKWSELNCTQHYGAFTAEVNKQVQSYAQLVHHEDNIVKALKKHLQIKNSLAYQPLLDLVVQLARDLQMDFYRHFHEFFEIITSLLNTQDTEILESAFRCLSYLFKFLWRYLVKDIQDVFIIYQPLLEKDQKAHIRNFAAESFSFLMRKIRDPGDLFNFMFSKLNENNGLCAGLGQLLFEMIKGVVKQFHSCTEKVLPLMLHKLGPSEDESCRLPSHLVYQALSHMLNNMLEYTNKENIQVVWECFQSEIYKVHESVQVTKNEAVIDQMNRLLQLFQQLIKRGGGGLIISPEKLVKLLEKILSGPFASSSHSDIILNITSDLLCAPRCNLTLHQNSMLINLVLKGKFTRKQVFSFVASLYEETFFDKDVLPRFLDICHSCMLTNDKEAREDVLESLAHLINIRRPLITDASQLTSYQPYHLDFNIALQKRNKSKLSTSIPEYILSLLDEESNDISLESNQARLWAGLCCVPHVRPMDKAKCKVVLGNILNKLTQLLPNLEASLSAKVLLMLSHVVLDLCVTYDTADIRHFLSSSFIMDLLRKFPENQHALLVGDIYFKLNSKDKTSTESNISLDEVYPLIKKNLSSPFNKVRLLSLHILSTFLLDLPTLEDKVSVEQVGIFRLCLRAEMVPVTLADYREKLKCLQHLDYNVVQYNIPKESNLHEVPLLYLVSMLYVNFRLLWEPVMELIRSHACGMDKKSFWKIYGDHLRIVAGICEQLGSNDTTGSQTPNSQLSEDEDDDNVTSLSLLFSSVYNDQVLDEDRPDYVNFRQQAWKAMHLFADRAELRSRELTPLFLKFIEKEYYPSDVLNAPTQDIQRRNERTKDSANQEKDVDETEDEEETSSDSNKSQTKQKHSVTQTLLAHLELFAKFRGPKSLYQEQELRKLYTNLLSHKYGKVQKTALDCLFAYKHKYLTPYQDHFKLLMDDKTFREEIALFNIDPEHGIVDKSHRAGLIPILMRILYGKMLGKAGAGTQGRAGSAQRRSVILRFLAGSEEEELRVFIDLVTEPCLHLIKDSCTEMLNDVKQSLDLSAVVPLKKLHSMIDTIAVIFSKLGHMVTAFLPMILRLIISLIATFTKLLDMRHQILPYHVNQLKTLRPLAIQRLVEFFTIFDNYAFSLEEVNCIFEAAVWPQISRLPNESITSPTTLLKMIFIWSKNPRFFLLLAKHHPDDKELTILPYVMALLKSKLTTKPVLDMVMDIVENLLVCENFEPNDVTKEIDVQDSLDVSLIEEETFNEPPTYGTKLIFPHVNSILTYLKATVTTKYEKKNLPMRELNILSRISLFVSDEEQCIVLVSLLLPYLKMTTSRNQNVELDILRTIRNVIKKTSDPSSFLGPVSKLLYTLTYPQSRVILVEVFASMAEKDETLKATAEMMSELNAWDKRHIEEPDFITRFKCFKRVCELIADWKNMDMKVLTPLINNCFFFISKVDEMSLRDNATNCLQAIIHKLQSGDFGDELFNSIIIHKFMPAIKEGIKLKNEVSRGEIVTLLRDIVKAFPHHPRFSDMTVLLDEDMEKDYFENIKHIQIHRRGRALRRLTNHCSNGELGHSNLYQYLLPLTSAMVFDQSLAKDQNFVVEAINTIGAITSQLPWKFYSVLLRQYLKLLTFSLEWQKVAVKLVVAILDAFHFDLSLSSGVESYMMFKKGVELVDEKDFKRNKNDVKDDLEKTEDLIEEDEQVVDETQLEEKERKVALATRIHHTIINSILPQLFKSITKKARTDDEHRSVRKNTVDDDEVLRVPIALAMVKLLQSLPIGALHQYLPNVLIKVCQMLKSRSRDIREVTRDTLVKILQSLGVNYFSFILKELKQALTRGYQLHVLAYTVNLLLKTIVDKLKHGDLDCCIKQLTEVFNSELFGEVAEEKNVAGIVVKLFEAKSTKSYDSYQLVSKFISQRSLALLILPLKEVLDNSHSHKMIKKVQEVLRRLEIGLLENSGIDDSAMLIFIHGLATESLPLVTDKTKAKKNVQLPRNPRLQPQSTYLLPETPKRTQKMPQMSVKTNVHIIVEFGLQLFYLSLKRSKFNAGNSDHQQMLDPFVQLLTECLTSKYTKVTTCALRCFSYLLKFPLPSLEANITKITQQLFTLLRNYARTGAGKGDNFELVVACFKAVTVLVRDVKGHQITDEQLQVLLSFAEEDIHDHTRQATAFSLLKAILGRQLMVPEIHDVMKKVAELSIRSEMHSVRLQCRQVVLHFLLDYPLGSKLKQHLEFYVGQLSFDEENGRVSALEMLATMFSSFPQKTLDKHYGLFFIPMATRLVNDDSAKCRKLVALALKSLLQKLDIGRRDSLFAMVTQWLNDEKVMHQRLAAQICGIFIEAERLDFDRRANETLKLIGGIISEQRFKKVMEDDIGTADDEEDLDHLLYHLLSTLAKMLHMCNIVNSGTYKAAMNHLWGSVEVHLLHPHAWVRLVTSQLFGILFAAWQPQEVVDVATSPESEVLNQTVTKSQKKTIQRSQKQEEIMENEKLKCYIVTDFEARFRELAYRFCTQLKSNLLDKDLSEQVIKNLVFIARVIIIYTKDELDQLAMTSHNAKYTKIDDVTTKKGDITANSKNGSTEMRKLEVLWLMNKMCQIGRTELAQTPKKTLKRTCMVKWLGAVSMYLGKEHVAVFLQRILKPLMREISDKMSHSDSELRILCQEVMDLLKSMVDTEVFTKAYAAVQKELNTIREGRKKKRVMQAVADPEAAAKRKIKKQISKKESKKRKLALLRPTYQPKKKKLKNTNQF